MIDDPSPNTSPRRSSPVKVSATPHNTAALNVLLSRLRRWEESNPVYREMLAAVDDRVLGRT